jgi:hypothetical protein
MSNGSILFALIACLTAACSSDSSTSAAIARQFSSSRNTSIDLAVAVPGAWEKVCVLGPYANNETARRTLGFEWDAEAKSSIRTNDGISLLLFVQGQTVVAYAEYPRHAGNFSNLSAQCFSQREAQFIHVQKPDKGWPGLFPRNAS